MATEKLSIQTAADGLTPIVAFTYPDAANRIADTSRVPVAIPLAVNKVAKQIDTGELYIVDSLGPLVWALLDRAAIHNNIAGEIAAVALKATPVAGDHLLIEDSAAANVKKRITAGALAGSLQPAAHAFSHLDGGSDEVATATPAADVIPKADAGGKLDAFVSAASETVPGKIEIATQVETDAIADDARAITALKLGAFFARGLKELSGPTNLVITGIVDGANLRRLGAFIVSGFFGTQWSFVQDDTSQTTTSSADPPTVVYTTGVLSLGAGTPAGDYLIGAFYMWSHENTSNDFICDLVLDGTPQGITHRQEPSDPGADQRHPAFRARVVTLTAAAHTIQLQFSSSNGNTAGIHSATLFAIRVS